MQFKFELLKSDWEIGNHPWLHLKLLVHVRSESFINAASLQLFLFLFFFFLSLFLSSLRLHCDCFFSLDVTHTCILRLFINLDGSWEVSIWEEELRAAANESFFKYWTVFFFFTYFTSLVFFFKMFLKLKWNLPRFAFNRHSQANWLSLRNCHHSCRFHTYYTVHNIIPWNIRYYLVLCWKRLSLFFNLEDLIIFSVFCFLVETFVLLFPSMCILCYLVLFADLLMFVGKLFQRENAYIQIVV